MAGNRVVSHEEWVKARQRHLQKEKEFTRLRDQLTRERQQLPWERVEKEYSFEGERGRQTLAEVFDGRSQLIVYHAMFNPDTAGPQTPWNEEAACFVCTWWMDNFDRQAIHLGHRDITIVAISRAPYPKIAAYKRRMGWSFPYLSSAETDFNFDYHVSFREEEIASGKVEYNYRPTAWAGSEAPGVSVFLKDADGAIFHTYSTYERGLDMLNVGYHYMDIAPKGRDETDGVGSWLHRRDEYPD